MPLMDALRSGVDLVNASNQGVANAATARYAFPMAEADLEKAGLANKYQTLINQYYGPEHQAAIDYQNIINKYQPEKSRLGNEYQGLVNQYYAPNIEAEINAKNAETQYTPLKYAIQAENAMRNNSRFGGAYQYLKSVADLPADQRATWLAEPNNYQQYMDMIQQLHSSVSSGQGSSSLITPALLKKVGLESLSQDIVGSAPPTGAVVSTAQVGGLSAPVNMGAATPQGQAPVVVNVPQQNGGNVPQPNMVAQGGMAAPVPGMMPQGAPPMMGGYTPIGAPPPMAGGAPMAPPQAPMAPPAQPRVAPTPQANPKVLQPQTPPLSPEAAQVAATSGVSPQEANSVANDAKNEKLTEPQKQLLGFQMSANKKLVGQYATNRALGAVTLEKLLVNNQDRFAPAFENAAKYAGLLGAGKLKMDEFRQQHPNEYADYMWITNDLIPNLGQNIRVMEGLASTDSQREALAEMYKSALSWKSDPKMAVRNINKTIDLFQSQAKAALETAQPRFPGVLEKLYGLDTKSRDYIGPGRMTSDQKNTIKSLSTEQLLKMYQGGK